MDLYPPTMIPCDVSIRHGRAYTRNNLPTHQPLPSAMPQPPCPYVSHLSVSSPPQTHYFHATDWSQCIHQVPGWEAAILPASIPEGLAEYINTHNQMDDIIDHCSDGSVANDTGSFGWAFGHQPAITFSHKGPAFGIPMDSYLAEGYGLLASVCFWYRIIELQLQASMVFKLRFHCDNKSLIRNVLDLLQFPNGSFRRALMPNFDVVYMIVCVLKCFPKTKIELLHVKGHQDDHQPTHCLAWAAQLNVAADQQAAAYYPTTQLPTEPILPSNQVRLLNSSRQPIIKRWNLHFRDIFEGPNYRQWLQRQFLWTDETIRQVDFAGLHSAIQTMPTHHQRFTNKWINQCLPVRRRVHRYDNQIPDTCCCCPTIIECDRHLLTCPSTTRRDACVTAFNNIQSSLERLFTEPVLQSTILHIVSQGFDIPTCAPFSTDTALWQQQQRIGTMAFLKGRWHIAFTHHQEAFYRRLHRPSTENGKRWIKHAIVTIITEIRHIWATRNGQTHGQDQAQQDKILRDRLTIRIDAIYNQLPNLLSHDRDTVVSISRDDLLSGPTSSLETWLRLVEPSMQQCLRDARDKLQHNQSDIRDFFEDASYNN